VGGLLADVEMVFAQFLRAAKAQKRLEPSSVMLQVGDFDLMLGALALHHKGGASRDVFDVMCEFEIKPSPLTYRVVRMASSLFFL